MSKQATTNVQKCFDGSGIQQFTNFTLIEKKKEEYM